MNGQRYLKDFNVSIVTPEETFQATVSAVTAHSAADMVARELRVKGAQVFYHERNKQFLASTERYQEAYPIVVTEVASADHLMS